MFHLLTNVKHFVLWLILSCMFASAYADIPKPFFSDSLRELETTYKDKPFLLSIWSLSCAPCVDELKTLGRLKKIHPDLNLVLLSADNPELANEAHQFLTKVELQDVNSWIYGSNQPERLRYAIDKNWYGEMPRSYFYSKDGKRQSVSGVIKEQILKNWIVTHFESN